MTHTNWSAAHSSQRMNWQTPRDLFRAIQRRWGVMFSLDVAAHADNAMCPRHYDEMTDGLGCDWRGLVWCNPPYGRGIGRWVEKARHEARHPNCEGVWMLIFARPDTRWWHNHVAHASEIVFLKGRVRFVHPDTGATNPAPAPSCVVVFREPLVNGQAPRVSHWDWQQRGGGRGKR